MKLSEHFTEIEFLRSQVASRKGIDNTFQSELHRSNARFLCERFLEPLRAVINDPIIITSGYRCLALNRAVGGSSTSAHVYGLAVDFIPLKTEPKQAFETLIKLHREKKVPNFDQLIWEYDGAWIHLGLSLVINRNQILKTQFIKNEKGKNVLKYVNY